MQSLCNPETGECKISYNIPSEELPSVEEKIVTVLGYMVVLLNKGREEVLSGRSILGNSFRGKDVNASDGRLPPLAVFRGEMKRCCESLHLALSNYITPFDARSTDIWRKLQRLKNICYDSGFSRDESYPSHTVFSNWNPVYFSSDNLEVAFWKGGQVTDEGLNWLMENGFKTIVDLRVEFMKDEFYQFAIDAAISYGKIQVVNMPIEVGTSPSLEQVEQFASLVLDPTKRPLYLHSQEGVGRTSAMVSRWRQYTVRSISQSNLSNNQSSDENSLSQNESDNSPFPNGSVSKKDDTGMDAADSQFSFYMDVDPFNAQIPKLDIFSRKAMSQFFRERNVSPQSYFKNQRKISHRQNTLPMPVSVVPSDTQPLSSEKIDNSNGKFRTLENGVNRLLTKENQTSHEPSKENKNLEPKALSSVINDKRENVDGLEIVDGNMCSSATGVVRLQSRKKAEMYLVRTDGFSCTREKVQETSLAFTHPSTQQQMLMWKSTPKTVLLLKKFGRELMEEAKQVYMYIEL